MREKFNLLTYSPDKQKTTWTHINWPLIIAAFSLIGTVVAIASQVPLK